MTSEVTRPRALSQPKILCTNSFGSSMRARLSRGGTYGTRRARMRRVSNVNFIAPGSEEVATPHKGGKGKHCGALVFPSLLFSTVHKISLVKLLQV